MNADTSGYVVVVWIPLVAVWVLVVTDLVRQQAMSRRARWAWGILCTLIWPAMIAYLLTRPTAGRLATAEDRSDPRARLVDLVLAREAGAIDDAAMAEQARELRRT